MELLIVLVFAALWGWLGSEITDRKGRGRALGAVLGAAFGIFAILVLAIIPATAEAKFEKELKERGLAGRHAGSLSDGAEHGEAARAAALDRAA